MYARVVRFTDVTAERISEIVAQVEESEGQLRHVCNLSTPSRASC
jgi:hypothetical protein